MTVVRRVKRHPIHTLRILAQLLFLALFIVLFVLTARESGLLAHPWLARLFLVTDPLILISTLLARSFVPLLFLSLVVVALVAIFPSVYCGWVCPLGTAMDIFDRLFFRKRDRSKNTGRHLRKIRYCLLALVFVLAIFGSGVVGWFDPVSIATRTCATVVLPIVDFAAKTVLIPAANSGSELAGNMLDAGVKSHLLFEGVEFAEGVPYMG